MLTFRVSVQPDDLDVYKRSPQGDPVMRATLRAAHAHGLLAVGAKVTRLRQIVLTTSDGKRWWATLPAAFRDLLEHWYERPDAVLSLPSEYLRFHEMAEDQNACMTI